LRIIAAVNSAPTTETPLSSRSVWWTALLVALVTVAVFSGTWSAEFVKWDDDINITRNTRIQELTPESVQWMFTDVGLARRYMPLGWIGFALHHAAFGLAPRSYHLANTVLFGLCAALLFAIIANLLRMAAAHRRSSIALLVCAALGTLIWSLHPLRVEVVAWASGRLYLQAAFFVLLATLAYLMSQRNERSRATRLVLYGLSLLAFAASLLTYPIALAFPAVVIALDVFPLRRFESGWWSKPARVAWLAKIPFVLVAAGQLAATFYARAHGAAVWQPSPSLADFSLAHRVMQAFYVWGWYVWKTFVPVELAPVYTRLVAFQPFAAPFLTSMAGVLALTSLVVWRHRRWRAAWLLWLVYLAWLVPTLGVTEHPHFTSDRYSLLAHTTLAVGVAGGLMALLRRRTVFRAAVSVVTLAVVSCAGMAIAQARVWRNSETLFRHTATVLGDDPYRADLLWRLGEVLAIQGRFAEAIAAYEESIRANPKLPGGHNGMGEVLAQQGRWRESLTWFTRATDAQPGFLRALNNIAWTLATAGDASVRNGKMALDLAIALNERSGIRNAQFLETLAAAYAETGQFERAVATAEQIPAMAKLSGEFEVAERNRKLLELYRARQPYRQAAPGN